MKRFSDEFSNVKTTIFSQNYFLRTLNQLNKKYDTFNICVKGHLQIKPRYREKSLHQLRNQFTISICPYNKINQKLQIQNRIQHQQMTFPVLL